MSRMGENSAAFFLSVRTRECTSSRHNLLVSSSRLYCSLGFSLSATTMKSHYFTWLYKYLVKYFTSQMIALKNCVNMIHYNLNLCSITDWFSTWGKCFCLGFPVCMAIDNDHQFYKTVENGELHKCYQLCKALTTWLLERIGLSLQKETETAAVFNWKWFFLL